MDKDISKRPVKENIHAKHRQRMYKKFIDADGRLPDHELVEILLYSCYTRKNTNELAHRLLREFGSIHNILSAHSDDLMRVDGIGAHTASFMRVMNILLGRLKESELEVPKIFTPQNVSEYLAKKFNGIEREELAAIFIDNKNRITKVATFVGTNDHIEVSLRELSLMLATGRPYAMVFGHNHTSGIPFPSDDDDVTTQKVALLLELNGVEFYDHIIVSSVDTVDTFSYFANNRLTELLTKSNFAVFSDYIKQK